MSSFSAKKHPKAILAFLTALTLVAGVSAHASDDRMAGTGPGVPKDKLENTAPAVAVKKDGPEKQEDKTDKDKKPEEKITEKTAGSKEEASKAPAAAPLPPPVQAKIYPVDYADIESAGSINTPEQGWLGVDLWTGSQHDALIKIISDAPDNSPYRILNDLKRRSLLSENDASLMYGRNSIQPGRDLLTVRIEKLNAMGAYDNTADLYTAMENEPYHENLAQAGITAMLMDGQVALACLEANAMKTRFGGESDFWKTIIPACSYILAKAGGLPPAVDLAEPASPVIARMIKKDNFRTDIRKLEDLRELKPLEQGLLMADGRLSYGDTDRLKISDMKPAELGLLVREKNLDEEFRFRLMAHMVDKGLRDVADLESFYDSVSFPVVANKEANLTAYDSVRGWQRLAFLYQSVKAARTNNDLNAKLVIKALELNKEYGISALLPFAGYLKYTKPDAVSDDLIRPGLRLAAEKNAELPAFWLKKWESLKKPNKEDLLISAGFDLSSNLSTLLMPKIPTEKDKENPLSTAESGLFITIYEKLDKKSRVIEYDPKNAYEKQIDLTADSGYVMPSTGLINDFDKAVRERRLGEVVFLSTIILNDPGPGNTINAGLLRKVMNGLETVGLTVEARELAREVISHL